MRRTDGGHDALGNVEARRVREARVEEFRRRVGEACALADAKKKCALVRRAISACRLSLNAPGKWIRFKEGQTESSQDVAGFDVGAVTDAIPVFMPDAESPIKISARFETPTGRVVTRVADLQTVARAVELDLPHWVVAIEWKAVDA